MEQQTDTKTEQPGTAGTEYVRPVEGRVLAGVSQGLANRLGLSVLLVRAFFVITAFFGGLGLALYAAGWGLMRSGDETESPAERFFGDAASSRSWIGIGLIFLAALILLDNLTFLSGGVVWAVGLLVIGVLLYTGHIPSGSGSADEQKEGVQQMTTTTESTTPKTETDAPAGDSPAGGGAPPPPTPTPTPPDLPPAASKPREPSILGRLTIGLMILAMGVLALLDNIGDLPIDADPRHYLALAVTILGVGLVVGGFAGRARWLIIIGAILVPTLMFSPVFEYDWNSEAFDSRHEPASFTQVEDVYSIDVGNLEIDLTDLPWDGETVELVATVDAGNLEIWIPDGVGVVGEASVDVGRVNGLGQESFGFGDPSIDFNEDGTLGTVLLDASVDVGNIDVYRR